MASHSHVESSLDRRRVIDVMHPGVIACPFETPLRTVARMMATYRVHAIMVVSHGGDPLPHGTLWGVVSDTDLIRAARTTDLDRETAGSLCATPNVTVTSVDSLDRAVELMVEHAASHLIVVERHSMRPVGVVSTLDVARALAGL